MSNRGFVFDQHRTQVSVSQRADAQAALAHTQTLNTPVLAPGDGISHPRLFFAARDLPALQAKAATTHREIWEPIDEYIRSQFGASPPSSPPEPGNLETFRHAGNQLIVLAFHCVVTQNLDSCDLAKSHLLAYARWEQWGEDHQRDLGLAHMLLGNALAYDWLYPALTTTERQLVRQNLAGWANKMAEASSAQEDSGDWRNWWRVSYIQNHFSTNNSTLGMAGLALLGEDERAEGWVAQAQREMAKFQLLLNGIQDGSWHEGIPYQNYGLSMALPFLINSQQLLGIDLFPHDYLRNYPFWRLYNLLPNSPEFNLPYGNFEWYWGNDYEPQGVLRFTASRYDNGYAEWTARQLIAAVGRTAEAHRAPWYVFEFLYYDPAIPALVPTNLPKARTFPDLGAVIWRTGWGKDDLIFGLKAGAYGGRFAFDTFTQQLAPWDCAGSGCEFNIGHEHDDNNGFYIRRAGHWLAPETIGYDRYETALHNTLLIDGQGQFRLADGRDPQELVGADGHLEATANTPGFDFVAADATGRYKNIAGIEDITRYVLFVRPTYFLMVDHVAANSAHTYEWVVHFGEHTSIEQNWLRGAAGNEQILGVGVVSPQPFATTTGDDGRPYVRVRPPSPVTDMRFINLLYPTDESGWATRPQVRLLADTGEAVLVRVRLDEDQQARDDILIRYQEVASTTATGPYAFDGQVAVVSRGEDDQVKKLFIYGGASLTDEITGIPLVQNLDQGEPFEAIYAAQAVKVQTQASNTITLYAPNAKQLFLNGKQSPFSRSGDAITFSWVATGEEQ